MRLLQTDYRRIIGAYAQVEIVNRFLFFVQRWKEEVPLPSDAFIPEWSQKSPDKYLEIQARGVNHLMFANHPQSRLAFERAFNDPNPVFNVK